MEKIPRDKESVQLSLEGRSLRLTNLGKPFWPDLGLTKGDLLRYYARMAPFLLPHLRDRAMVMKRYPQGAAGKFFFMKRAPSPRPGWIETCAIRQSAGKTIEFPMIQDLPSLLWVINLGCIDLNPWNATFDDAERPDQLCLDLDPAEGASFRNVLEAALAIREALDTLNLSCHAKTSGSRGIHIHVPIWRGPTQKQVWTFAKALARTLEARHPRLLTTEYQLSRRPRGRILLDYRQNARGQTLASVYSVRPTPRATVSAPVTWREVQKGFRIEDFRINNISGRLKKLGDLWKPLLQEQGRARLETFR